MTGYSSTIPRALAYLVQLWTAEVINQGWTDAAGHVPDVVDGPSVPDTSARTALYVGWHGWAADVASLDPTGVESTTTFPGGLAGPDMEEYTVHCAAQALNGDSDSVLARGDAFGLRDLAVGAVVLRRGLGGGGSPAGMQLTAGAAAGGLRHEQTGNGALATVQFDIEVRAFTSR